MFNINISIPGPTILNESFDPKILQQGLVDAATYVRDVWHSAVMGNVLPGMERAVNSEAYGKALQAEDSIKLLGPFQVMIAPVGSSKEVESTEKGYGPYDMKPGLLGGSKSKPLKSGLGRYTTVPMRHKTPGGKGISINLAMPNSVYRKAKKLTPSTMDPDSEMVWGDKLKWDSPLAVNLTGYSHKSSIYSGMFRVGNPGQMQYLTFRRVSTSRVEKGKQKGSDPQSWWHPGLPGVSVVQAVFNFCTPQIEKTLTNLLDSMFQT